MFNHKLFNGNMETFIEVPLVVYVWAAPVEQEGKAAKAFALILFFPLAFRSTPFQLPVIVIYNASV